MDNDIDNEFREAVVSKDFTTVKTIIKQSNQQLDDKFIVDQLIENKWLLQNIVKLGEPNLTKLVLESSGESININNNEGDYGRTALHQAAYENDIAQVKLLLDYNADPNSLDRNSYTPLFSLYENTNEITNHSDILQIMKMLIDRGAKVLVEDQYNFNLLQIRPILYFGNVETVEFVLKLDIDLRARYDRDGDTVLHSLAWNRHPNLMKKVMNSKDFNVNARNHLQATPLWVASNFGVMGAIEFLLSEGADANATDINNWSPLWIATVNYPDNCEIYMKCIQLLLQYGADVQVVSKSDLSTVFDLILEFKDEDDKLVLFKLMLEHLAFQEANGTKITEYTQSKFDKENRFREYFDFCKELLAKKGYESETLLKLLCCSEEKLVPYMRNAEFVRITKDFSDALKSQTVSYGNWLGKRLEKANQTAALRDSAAIVISKLMQFDYDSYYSIVDEIISYLKDQDLNVLLNISL